MTTWNLFEQIDTASLDIIMENKRSEVSYTQIRMILRIFIL